MICVALLARASAQAEELPGKRISNKNVTTNKKVAAYNQGYASAMATDVCNHHLNKQFLKVLDEDLRNAMDGTFIDDPILEPHWKKGQDDAKAQGMAALDAENGLAIDALCRKAQKLPMLKGYYKWLDETAFTEHYGKMCRETPGYYMCKTKR